MGYRELRPPPALARHVACLWWRSGPPPRVLPDGCTDVVWTGERLIVAGPATGPAVPDVKPDAVKLGVRFRVGAAAAVLGLPAGELRDRSPGIRELRGDAASVEERLGECADPVERLRMLVALVAEMVRECREPDPVVRAVAHELARGRRVAEAAARGGISQRQLRRRFDTAVGYPPKTLARVLRLQRFLRAAADGTEPLARLAADAGYSDQAHLARDCRALAGLPPSALLAARSRPAGERLSAA